MPEQSQTIILIFKVALKPQKKMLEVKYPLNRHETGIWGILLFANLKELKELLLILK